MTDPRIFITIHAEIPMDLADVWPDEDQPPHPTALDVARKIAESRSVLDFIDGWSLKRDVVVTADVDGTTVDVGPADWGKGQWLGPRSEP